MKKIILFVVFIFPIFICAQTVCFNEVNNNTAVGTPTLQSISESTSGDFNNDGFDDLGDHPSSDGTQQNTVA